MKYTSLFENQRINILFIIIVNMLVYLNVVSAGVSTLDDSGLFQALYHGEITLSQQFLSGGGHYFRPLTTLSYLIDYTIWNNNPAAFHVTNLIIHITNTILLYSLVLTFLTHESNAHPVALISALIFATHPINSESVIWISGRTDLLCTLFFLLSLLIIMRTNSNNILISSVLLFLAFTSSLLAKESSIALVAIAPAWFFTCRKEPWDMRATTLCVTLVVAVNFYIILRSGVSGHIDSGISAITSTVMRHDKVKTGYDTLAVIGFYIKKMIVPFPLTIAIDVINTPLYVLFGCGVIAATARIFFTYEKIRLSLVIIVCGLVPPLLAYHGNIPWMPLAERYLYLPLVGATILAAVTISYCTSNWRPLWFVVILAMAVATTFRVEQWGEPVAFWKDALKQTPSNPAVRVIYAYELQKAGNFFEAGTQLDAVSTMKYEDVLYWRCKAQQSLSSNNLAAYEADMSKVINLSPHPSKIYNEIAVTLANTSKQHPEHHIFLSKSAHYYEKGWELDHRATAGLYNAARLSLQVGDKEGCLRLLNLYLATPEKKPNTEKAQALLNELTFQEQSHSKRHPG